MTDRHGVLVNEARLLAVGLTQAAWWVEYAARRPVVILLGSIGGCLVWVPCDDREHAVWLAALFVENGAPHSSVAAVASSGTITAAHARKVGCGHRDPIAIPDHDDP